MPRVKKDKMDYDAFLKSKFIADKPTGFEVDTSAINSNAFDWQKPCIQWSLRRGRSALFEAPGLGKTLQELSIAHETMRQMDMPSILFAPLCVANQTVREAEKFGFEDVKYVRHQSEVTGLGIYVSNYEMEHHFQQTYFGMVGCDESSLFKSREGHYKTKFCEDWTGIPNRLCGTATPSPNDYAELGNHAEFLGVMSRAEMEATFFYHDGGETSKWTLMPHAQEAFWKWVASWAILIRTPSDIGFSDDGYILPKLHMHEHILPSEKATEGYIIPMPAKTLQEQRKVKRDSIEERCSWAARIACADELPHVIWTELNDEGDILEELIPGSVQISGKDSAKRSKLDPSKSLTEEKILAFCDGNYTKLITKCSIAGYGINMQFSHNATRANITHSAEDMYQEIRRQYRFGQKEECNYHLVMTEAEQPILTNVKRKQSEAEFMAEKVVGYMRDSMIENITGSKRQRDNYNPQKKMEMPKWIKSSQ